MPPIRSVTCIDDSFSFMGSDGILHQIFASEIPASNNTVAKVQAFANTWLAANVVGFQAQVHVFSLSPFRVIVTTANLGETIRPNWWLARP